MHPGSRELDKSQGGQEGGNGMHGRTEGGDEDASKDSRHQSLNSIEEDTAEEALETTDGMDEASDGAERGSDGFGSAVGRTSGAGGIVGAVFVLERNGFVGWRVLVLDNGEDGIDGAERVYDL